MPETPAPQPAPAEQAIIPRLASGFLETKDSFDKAIVEIGHKTHATLSEYLRYEEPTAEVEDKGLLKNIAFSTAHAADGIVGGPLRATTKPAEPLAEGLYATYETSHLWRIFTDTKNWLRSTARIFTSAAQTAYSAVTESTVELLHSVTKRTFDKGLHQINQSIEKTGIGKLWTIPTNLASRGLSKITGGFKWLKDKFRTPLDYIHEATAGQEAHA